MKCCDNFSCVIGKDLLGIAKEIRPRKKVKTDERVLREYNNNYCVLKDNCNCKIHNPNIMLSDDEYSRCVETLRTRGYIVYHEKTDELEGRRIFCEFSKEPKPLRVTGRQQVLISSKIAVAVISCPEQKSGIYSMSERWVKNPNNPSGT